MIQYTLIFIFNQDLKKGLFIRKTHPEWCKGKLNGLGGKVQVEDYHESSQVELNHCAIRELREETSLDLDEDFPLHEYLDYTGPDYTMRCYWTIFDYESMVEAAFSTQTHEEKLEIWNLTGGGSEMIRPEFMGRDCYQFLKLAYRHAKETREFAAKVA